MSDTPAPLLTRATLLARARALLAEPNLGDMGHSLYDAAWVARVRKPGTQESAFPEMLKDVRDSQAPDGGWAPEVDYMSGRILTTLSCMLAVTEFDKGPEALMRANRGASFVWDNWPRLKNEPDLVIAFELVAGALLAELCDRGFEQLGALRAEAEALQQDKLKKVPLPLIYAPQFSLGFSLEFLYDKLDVEKARQLQIPNGTVAAGIAATAYYVMRSGDEAGYRALQELVAQWGPRNLPFGTGTRLWAAIWTLYHLRLAGMDTELGQEFRPLLQYIHECARPFGLAWSADVAFGDSDDTAVAFGLLHDNGFPVDWSRLTQYERPDGFCGFLAERGASVSANAHVLESIQNRPYPGGSDSANKAARFLLAHRRPEGFWTDKWHVSPYYVTSRAVRALLRWETSSVLPSLQWLVETQRQDGGWGWFGRSTPEETAYALHALAAAHNAGLTVDASLFAGGSAYLMPYDGTEPADAHPPLWIGKGLYRPLYVVHSAVIAAQTLCAQALGGASEAAKTARAAAAR